MKRAHAATPARDSKRARSELRPDYKRLKDARLPREIAALPHVMERIDSLLMTRDEAVEEAIRTRDSQWFKSLSRGPTDDIMFEGIVAAEMGDFNSVRDLLEELEDNREFDTEEHAEEWRILEEAAANGHIEIVDVIIEYLDDNGGRESCGYENRAPDGRKEALARAISAGQYDVVDRLLNPYLFSWDLVSALGQALDEGKESIAELVYKTSFAFHYVSTQCVDDYEYMLGPLGDLLVEVACRGRLHLLEYVYKKREHSTKVIDLAFHEAAKIPRYDVVAYLLSGGRVTMKEFETVFCGAARAGSIELVKFVYNKCTPSSDLMTKAFQCTTGIDVMKYLSRNMFVSTKSILRAFQNASANGLAEIASFLCSTGSVPSDIIRKAFVSAARCRHASVVRALRCESCIGPNEINEAFSGAHNVDVVKILCAEPCITREMIMHCFLQSARNARTDVVKFLFEEKLVSDVTVRETFYKSISSGDFIVVGSLIKLACILHEDRAKAFVAAARHDSLYYSISSSEDWSEGVLQEALNATTSRDTRRYLLSKLQPPVDSRF